MANQNVGVVRRRGGGGGGGRLMIAGVMALLAIVGYFTTTRQEMNPFTGEVQRVAMSPEQEIALGLQAAPSMAAQHGGLHPDEDAQAMLDQIGQRVADLGGAEETPYRFEFHLLADRQTVNAFALPGGQIFLTVAIVELFESEDELAAVLAHEIGHVVGRHSAATIAKAKLAEGLSGAAAVAVIDPSDPSWGQTSQAAAMIGQAVTMRYTREHELEADELAVQQLVKAGYDPYALITVMEKLNKAGGQRQPEFLSTHPDPGRRVERIRAAIAAVEDGS